MAVKNKTELIFVYNANSGVASAMVDYGKKLVAPSTYDCQLCMATYGPFGMKKDWKNFIESLEYPVRFLHKDEFVNEFSDKATFPCMIKNHNGKLTTAISSQEFSKIESLDDLKTEVSNSI